MAELAAKICRRLSQLKSSRAPHEAVWRECFEYSFPERAHGIQTTVASALEIQQRKAKLLDSTATDAGRVLSAGLQGGTTPANSRWFGLDVGIETEDEKRWLDGAAQAIFENIHAANFDSASYECTLDMVGAGWFVLYIDEAKGGGYQFSQWPIAQCYVSASHYGGRVDTIYREFELTVEQCVEEYGQSGVSDKTRRLYANAEYDKPVKVVHAIYPREIYAANGARMAKNKPFASCHIEVEGHHLLREGGYDEFPCAVPRWRLIPETAYGIGPMSDALPDVKELNEIRRMELASLDLAISGMWIAEDDGVLNPRTIKLGPRKIIVANSADSMKELKSGADFNVAFTSEERLQAKIRKTLMADQLQPMDGPAMTATEVHVRVAMVRQLLGPVFGRLQSEYLAPLIERCFGIAFRAGVLGIPPQSLANRPYSVRYLSPLARAQKLEDVTAIDQFVMGLAQMAQVDQTVLDNCDFDQAVRLRGEALGVPAAVQRSQKDMDALRERRNEARKQAEAQDQQQQLGMMAAEAATKKAAVAA